MAISKRPHAALLSSPGMGHQIPFLELAKSLVSHHGFSATVFFIATEAPPPPPQFLCQNLLQINYLPLVDISNQNTNIGTKIALIMHHSLPNLRSAIASMNSPPAVLVVDFFGTESLALANEFCMAKYVYVPCNAWFVALSLYVPTLDKEGGDNIKGQLKIPGCKPIRFEDLLDPLKDRNGDTYRGYIRALREIMTADGVLMNTWEELEPTTVGALMDQKILKWATKVPVYPVGPLIRQSEPSDSKSYVLDWLDMQPTDSVLYVSFGSGGLISARQITELAWGLEQSRKKFVWVLRPPTEFCASDYLSLNGCNDDQTLGYLPDGFLTRTDKMGLVVQKWAPQAEVLAHPSVGGFLSHCGWNSTLESIANGVPIIAWPLYAEQNMNATLLVEELGVAVRPTVLPSVGVVGREEIEKMVRRVMDEKEEKEMRDRVQELKISGEKALRNGGSSFNSLAQLAKNITAI